MKATNRRHEKRLQVVFLVATHLVAPRQEIKCLSFKDFGIC